MTKPNHPTSIAEVLTREHARHEAALADIREAERIVAALQRCADSGHWELDGSVQRGVQPLVKLHLLSPQWARAESEPPHEIDRLARVCLARECLARGHGVPTRALAALAGITGARVSNLGVERDARGKRKLAIDGGRVKYSAAVAWLARRDESTKAEKPPEGG